MKTIYLAGALMLTTVFFGCRKDTSESSNITTVTPKKPTTSDQQTVLSPSFGARIETYIPNTGGCKSPAAKCINGHPTVTDTYAGDIAAFDLARESSPTELADLLTENHELAVIVFPDWDEEYMAPAREMILSGEYFLLKKNGENKFFYVLTQETSNDDLVDDVLANDTYVYVFSYEL